MLDLYQIIGSDASVSTNIRSQGTPLSGNTINSALRSLGYPEILAAHGFERNAHDSGRGACERVDLIEHPLAHQVKDLNGRAHNWTAHLPA